MLPGQADLELGDGQLFIAVINLVVGFPITPSILSQSLSLIFPQGEQEIYFFWLHAISYKVRSKELDELLLT